MDDLQQTLDEAIRAYKSGDAALQWQPLSWCGKSLAFTTPLTAGLAFRRGAFMTRSMHTKPTERKYIGNQINAGVMFAWTDFVNVHRWHE